MPPAEPPCLPLGADERVPHRPFCDPEHTPLDLATLSQLRRALERAARGSRGPTMRFADDIGVHQLSVPDWAALESAQPAALIGFFGQAREEVDHAAIVALEDDIVARAPAFPGLLAYHNARLANGQWGNLVAFASRAATGELVRDPAHVSAIARTPLHYASLRLHRGVLPDGALGALPATIDETLYLDFGETPAWRALRVYAES
jgi:hypothetical protein